MKYLSMLLTVLLLSGCSSPDYAYRQGSKASLDNQRFDRDECADHAFNKFFDANPGARLHAAALCCTTSMLAVGAGIDVIMLSTRAKPSGPPMKEADINPEIDRCMSSKGYIEK